MKTHDRPMPRLASDDADIPSWIAIAFGEPVEADGTWLPFSLEIVSGPRTARLEDREGQIGRCWLGLAPKDELDGLVAALDDLQSGQRHHLRFEPSEPNFSLEIERAPEGWVVVCWLDAGNQISDHFTWDALGVRFFTNSSNLAQFREALANEHPSRR